MSRARYHYHHRRRPVGLPVVPLLVLCAVVLAAVGVAGAILITVLAALLPVMLFAVGTVVVVRHLHRRHRRAVGRRQPAAAPPLTKAAPTKAAVPDWRTSRARFAQLRGEYGRFECDPLAVLRLPALADVTVPATSRFVDAFAEAQALDTDTEPSAAHLARYATAVEAACRAWQAARETAERIRLAGIPEQERATVARAIKLLTMARDSDHDAERIAAYAKARTELAKLERSGTIRLPVAAAAAVDAAARGQLPASEATT